MADGTLGSADHRITHNEGRLDSWKEIAAYLKRDVTTVRRWEKREGLPVHRHPHARRDSVYAFQDQLDEWWHRRGAPDPPGTADAGAGIREDQPSGPSPNVSRWHHPGPWVMALVLLVTLAAAVVVAITRRAESPLPMTIRFSLTPPADTSFGSVALAPDGHAIAFTARPRSGSEAKARLWIRALDALDANSLPDTEDAAFPFWSADSQFVAFFASGRLWVVAAAGGTPRAVADAPDGAGGTWNRDGTIVFSPRRDGGLARVSSAGGPVTGVTHLRSSEHGHLWPEFLPDGHHFLFFAHGHQNAPEDHNLFVGTLDGAPPRHLFSVDSHVVYSDGYLVYLRDRHLVAQRFDLQQLAALEEPATTIVDRVQQQPDFAHKGDFAVAPGGVLLYRRMQSPSSRLIWRDRNGHFEPLANTPAEYYSPAVSPDDRHVAFTLFDPAPSPRFGFGIGHVRSDVWLADRVTGARSQVTSDPASDWGPVWSPDGARLVFSSNRTGTLELFLKDVSPAMSPAAPLATRGNNPVAQSWSPDGRYVIYTAFDPKTRGDLWLLPMSGDPTPVPFLRTAFSEQQGQVSPDGRWIAYTSTASGREEVWVQSFPKPSTPVQISFTGAGDPRWSRDGREMFFISADRQLVALPVTPGLNFVRGSPAPLFDTGVPPHWYEARNLYDVSRDGRLLLMRPFEDDRGSAFTVVVNWPKPGA